MCKFVLKPGKGEGHCYSGLHVQKENMLWAQEESPPSDPGENKTGRCIQFGDLIRRKRETHCRKF